MYSLFRESADKEQELYQAVARAGTLLLQIGDAARQEEETKSSSDSSFVKSYEIDEDKPVSSEQQSVFSTQTQLPNSATRVRSSDQQSIKPDNSETSPNDNIPDDLGLNIRVQGMTLAEALADAQRSLSSSPGRAESIKSEDYVYVDDSQESKASSEISQNNFARTEYEGMIGSSYKEIASCIGDSPEIIYKELETEATQSSPLKKSEKVAGQKVSDLTLRTSRVVPGASDTPVDSGTVSDKWKVGFRQFIACVLSEPSLVEFFEQRYDLKDALENAKSEGLQTKSSDDSVLDQSF